MADFAYCAGEHCPLKEQCLRHRRYVKERDEGTLVENQSYLLSPYNNDTEKCEMFVLFQRPVS